MAMTESGRERVRPEDFLSRQIAHYGDLQRFHKAGITVGRQAEEALRLNYNDPSRMTAQQRELASPLNMRAAIAAHEQGGGINTYNSARDLEKSYDRILQGSGDSSSNGDMLGLSREDYDRYSDMARGMGLNKGGGALSANDLAQVRARESSSAVPAAAPAAAPSGPPPQTQYERDEIARQETGNPWANRFSGHPSQQAEPDWYQTIIGMTNNAAQGMEATYSGRMLGDASALNAGSRDEYKEGRNYLDNYMKRTGMYQTPKA